MYKYTNTSDLIGRKTKQNKHLKTGPKETKTRKGAGPVMQWAVGPRTFLTKLMK